MGRAQPLAQRALRTVSVFSGAGGIELGLEAAGFQTAVAIELDRTACETLRRNRPWPVIERDVVQVASQEALDAAGLAPGEADLLAGGPPCQPFSKAGYWSKGDSRRLEDPRANTLGEFLRLLEDLTPRAFLLENVEGLAYREKDEGIQFLLRRISQINEKLGTAYAPTFQILNAADFGVPQVRRRLIVVAERDGRTFEFPTPTHGTPECPFRNCWDAIGDLETPLTDDLRVRGRWAPLLPSIPEGQNYLWHTNRGGGRPFFGWRTRFWSFLLKLKKTLPSWTIQAQPGPSVGPFHWANRRLSIRELCRLQTFPDDVEIVGSRLEAQRQLGNAVPALLTEVLGRAIAEQFFGRTFAAPPTLLPPKRSPVPPAERVRPVPKTMKPPRRAPREHPGEGRGPGARSRRTSR